MCIKLVNDSKLLALEFHEKIKQWWYVGFGQQRRPDGYSFEILPPEHMVTISVSFLNVDHDFFCAVGHQMVRLKI
jgi:hypothetical protein